MRTGNIFRLVLAFLLALPIEAGILAQTTHISNTGIYDFLDELAGEQIIELSSLVKPYTRDHILEKLEYADSLREKLNTRQQYMLDFYLSDYAPYPAGSYWLWMDKGSGKSFDGYAYADSSFKINFNPIFGADIYNNSSGTFYHWWNGIEASSSWGRFRFWASLRDNHDNTPLVNRDYMNQEVGGANFKNAGEGKRDYEEMRAGVIYEWEKGHIGIIKDQFSWGENYAGSNILSGRTPSFARLDLSLRPAKWFEFSYFHAALISEVVDSSRSFWVSNAYGDEYREEYHNKYMAANMFTFIPVRGLQLTAGNAVIYDFDHPHLAYLIPFMFFKAVDHTLTARIDNMNSSMFFSFSSRNLRNFHFYGSIFIDELQMGRITKPDEHNFVSFKAGAASYLIPNTRLVAEYTWTNALAFMHYISTTTYESNSYNLGHYLEDNAQELYLGADYRPWRTVNLHLWYRAAFKGPDHTALGSSPRDEITPFDPVAWERQEAGILASMQLINDLYLRLGYTWSNITGEQAMLDRWTPNVYHGNKNTLRFGINYGF